VKDNPAKRLARFDEVLEQYRGRLGRIAQTYAGRESDDLLQEILLQIWRSLPGFEDRSSIGT
jgi:DNA-directed RNA polymerase specialized sigma24 family protein